MTEQNKLSEISIKIDNTFGLQKQGRALIALVTQTIDALSAYLLFLDPTGQDFTILSAKTKAKDNPLPVLKLSGQNPVIEYLKREKKVLTRESSKTLSRLMEQWKQDAAVAVLGDIELFIPLLSSDRLIGVLALGKKKSGGYTPEDLLFLCNLTSQVAVGLEKEYLVEQLEKRNRELTVLNRAGTIITSNLDIQAVFDDFINELRKAVDITWSTIVLIRDNNLYFLALSSGVTSTWKTGEQLPLKDTGTEWVTIHREAIVEPDLSKENRFVTAQSHLKQGLRSIAYLPLNTGDKVIGSLVIASTKPHAYQQSDIIFLEQLASQIAAPIENARLYTEVEEKARIDDLTGLLNRRSLDEIIVIEISRHSRYGGVFSLISLDIDSLKAVNDQHGHLAGDRIIREVGHILRKSIRIADQAFRYGGDEFAILLPNTSVDSARKVAERIRKQISSTITSEDIHITVSIGLACWPANGKEVTDIISNADAALYQAKRSGGNRIRKAEKLNNNGERKLDDARKAG